MISSDEIKNHPSQILGVTRWFVFFMDRDDRECENARDDSDHERVTDVQCRHVSTEKQDRDVEDSFDHVQVRQCCDTTLRMNVMIDDVRERRFSHGREDFDEEECCEQDPWDDRNSSNRETHGCEHRCPKQEACGSDFVCHSSKVTCTYKSHEARPKIEPAECNRGYSMLFEQGLIHAPGKKRGSEDRELVETDAKHPGMLFDGVDALLKDSDID